jgi:hypothetical protein
MTKTLENIMKKTLITLCLAALASGVSAGSDESAELDQAKKATAEFAGALKSELVAAMQSGGPIEAIDVCNTRAVLIGEEVSLEQGMTLSRVSQKNRNPDNAPNEWQAAVLESFEARKAAGEAPGTLAWHEVADTGTGKEFRFMKAIPTGAVCLACHGETLAPPVAEKLAELYPEDKATGYSEGDIRGAFVVTQQLDR